MPMRKKPDKFYNWHRAFVQMLITKGFMTGPEMFVRVKSICLEFVDNINCIFCHTAIKIGGVAIKRH